jgi:hypothetical protein
VDQLLGYETLNFTVAVKCAPVRGLLAAAQRAGFEAAELYLDATMLDNVSALVRTCRAFKLRYALHAPNDAYRPHELRVLAQALAARVVVFHSMYWDDQWAEIAALFKESGCTPCVENIGSVHEPARFMLRWGWGRCLDLEHLQIECAGFYEEEFLRVIKGSSHIHLTGYRFGSERWHTHIHHDPSHARYVLGVIKRSGFKGMVVSEARASMQTYAEFKALRAFVDSWQKGIRK